MGLTLADRFRELDFTAEASRDCPPRHALIREDTTALLFRQFRDGVPLTEAETERVRDAIGTHLPAALQISFVEDLYVFSDWRVGDVGEVLPPGETTAILFQAARRLVPVDTCVDIGCGCGTLALLLARYAGRVIATDINPRAVELCRLNAEVNGISNVECRCGDLLEPLENVEFDLLVSQPPYVPQASSEERHLYLSGGTRGDEIARRLMATLKERLSPTAAAVMFSDWPLGEAEHILERLPLDGLSAELFVSPAVSIAAYARHYGDELVSHLAEQQITSVRQCLAVLRLGSQVSVTEVLPHEWPGTPGFNCARVS